LEIRIKIILKDRFFKLKKRALTFLVGLSSNNYSANPIRNNYNYKYSKIIKAIERRS